MVETNNYPNYPMGYEDPQFPDMFLIKTDAPI